MADQLYLTLWLRNHSALALPRQFEKLIETFPHSKLSQTEVVLRVHAVSFTEPAVLETVVPLPVDAAAVVRLASEFQGADACYELSTAWDLWTFDRDWKLAPARVSLAVFGPEFEREQDESACIGLGIEDRFLPSDDAPGGLKMVRSNIQSLLRLVRDIDEKLTPVKKVLWSESGENFAERLQAALG